MADTFAGRILLAASEPEGWITVEQGRVLAWGKGESPVPPRATGWIVPSAVNAHTHVADAFLRERPGKPHTVAELFGPGGWKHQHLAKADTGDQSLAAEKYVGEMAACGTSTFIDFREGGLPGVQWLRGLDLDAQPFILGRPAKGGADEREMEAVIAAADGIGISGVRDMKAKHIEAWAEACHDAKKPFSIHVSEDARDDIDLVLSWEPSFVIHMTQATPSDLESLAHERVPVVVCPRSNAHFGWKVPLAAMREAGCTVAVGTDNGMLQDGDLWKELALLRAADSTVTDPELLRMACHNGRSLVGLPPALPPVKGAPMDALVLPTNPIPAPQRQRPGLAVNPDLPVIGDSK